MLALIFQIIILMGDKISHIVWKVSTMVQKFSGKSDNLTNYSIN